MIIFHSENSFSIRQIILKLASEILPIRHVQCPFALLHILSKVSLILYPARLNLIKMLPVDRISDVNWVLIIEDAIPMKLVLAPLSFVGQFPIYVVKRAPTLHFVPAPLAGIFPTFFVKECPEPVSHALLFISFISSTAILLSNVVWACLATRFENSREVIFFIIIHDL